MKAAQFLPAEPLRPFIKTFMIIESEGATDSKVLPDTALVMAFRCRGKVLNQGDCDGNEARKLSSLVAPWVISGLQKTPKFLHYSGGTINLLVIFREGGPAAFFREPLHLFSGITLSLDNLFPRRILMDMEEQLGEAGSDAERIALAEGFFLSRLIHPEPDLLIQTAIHRIRSVNGMLRIKDLFSGLYISKDAFEKRFRRIVGTTPKQYASLVRWRHLLNYYSGDENLTALAYRAGYFDQAHFIKDFRAFTGMTPAAFFGSPHRG